MPAPSSSIGLPPAPPLAVSVDLPGARVQVVGELDRASAHHLLDALELLSTRASRRWRLDAGGVTFCDAEGLRAISSAYALAAAHGRNLQLVRSSRSVDRLVQLLGHDRAFPGSRASGGPRRAPVSTERPPARSRHIRCGTTGTA